MKPAPRAVRPRRCSSLLLSPARPRPPDAKRPLFGELLARVPRLLEGVFQKQNGVVLVVLGVGAVALFIITRGKWKK